MRKSAERGPLVVAVDDVQWVDDPSLAWLGYLARRAGDLAQLLVLGLRSGDPGGERGELEITRRGQVANALTGFLDDDGEDLSATGP